MRGRPKAELVLSQAEHEQLTALSGPDGLEYQAIRRPFAVPGAGRPQRLWECWRLVRGRTPHQPTFRPHDTQHGSGPIACDFVFMSEALKNGVAALSIDAATQASDHQPVAVELA